MGLEIIDKSYTVYSRTLFDLVTKVWVHLDSLSSNIVYVNYLLAFKFSQDKTCCQEEEYSQIYSIYLSFKAGWHRQTEEEFTAKEWQLPPGQKMDICF